MTFTTDIIVYMAKITYNHKMKQNIKLVDGFKIRNTIEIEFSMIGDHDSTPFIPKGQIWLEQYYKAERDSIVQYFLKRKTLSKKIGYEKAKAKLRPSKISNLEENCKQLIIKEGTLKIFLVDGSFIRQQIDPSFCFGGHYQVYKYIPKNELWLDDCVDIKEIPYILVHELKELDLMKFGMSYCNAHDYANAAEKEARRNDGVAKYPKD